MECEYFLFIIYTLTLNMINQKAVVRAGNLINIRSLQRKSICSVGSIVDPDNIRDVNPKRIAIRLEIEEVRNNKAHEFERSGRRDKTRILSILPIQPNRNNK